MLVLAVVEQAISRHEEPDLSLLTIPHIGM
jgi:hypothetical protein